LKQSYYQHLDPLCLYRPVLLSVNFPFQYVAAGKGSNNHYQHLNTSSLYRPVLLLVDIQF